MKDFTLKTYVRLLIALKEAEYSLTSVIGYLTNHKNNKCAIVRHDVDAFPQNSLLIAKLEKEFNVTATYYFKTKPVSYDEMIISQIAALGNEIGYHYEDLSDAKGDSDIAIRSFEQNLEILRRLYPVKTICMDGNAWSKWNNLDLWEKYDYRNYGIIAEPYLDLDFNKMLYLTDTGRKWNGLSYSVWDKVKNNFEYINKSTGDIISDLNLNALPDQIMINTHPQRWTDKSVPWLKELVLQNLKNVVKRMIVKSAKLRV